MDLVTLQTHSVGTGKAKVDFGYSLIHKKWQFNFRGGKGCYLSSVRGKLPVAEKMALAISGSVKRNPISDVVDGLAKARLIELNPVR